MSKKNVLVLGAGKVGRVVAKELAQEHNVSVVDIDDKNLALLSTTTKKYRMPFDQVWHGWLTEQPDLIVNCLPGKFGREVLHIADIMDVSLVDISFMPQEYITNYHTTSNKLRILDCGVAPGLANMMVGELVREGAQRVQILVGGLSLVPKGIWKHRTVFCPEDTLEEYLRPAHYKEKGKIFYNYPLDTITSFGPNFECFISDGLRSLLDIDMEDLVEYTFRHVGHLALMKGFSDSGILQNNSPDNILRQELLKEMAIEDNEEDYTYLRVVSKNKDGSESKIHLLQDYYHRSMKTHSMPRCTAMPAVFVAKKVLADKIPVTDKIVFMPEDLILDGIFPFSEIADFMNKKEIKVTFHVRQI